MIINSITAAYLNADCAVPNKRPNSKVKHRTKRLFWDDATQEQKDNLTWIQTLLGTYTIIPNTKEEEHEIWLDQQYHLQQMLDYILNNYGFDTYNKIIDIYKDRFDEYEVEINNDFLHCKYADGQCDLFCKYYKCGGCRYEERLDQTVRAM